MTKISSVMFDGKTFELVIPVHLSDDEVQFANRIYDSELTAACADAFFLFNIIQKEIAQLMADKNGKWETDEDGTWHCSVCGATIKRYEQGWHHYRYCYHCGSKMNNVEEEK